MPAKPPILYPDPRLTRPAAPVTAFDAGLRALARDVAESLEAVGAAGLTAPHLGVLLRVAVLRPEPGGAVSVYLNPEIAWASPELSVAREGSVSMPGVADDVSRPAAVRVRYRDLGGAPREEEADGFRAACLQHEIDQLDGIFWVERLSRLRRERLLRRYAKLTAAERRADPSAR